MRVFFGPLPSSSSPASCAGIFPPPRSDIRPAGTDLSAEAIMAPDRPRASPPPEIREEASRAPPMHQTTLGLGLTLPPESCKERRQNLHRGFSCQTRLKLTCLWACQLLRRVFEKLKKGPVCRLGGGRWACLTACHPGAPRHSSGTRTPPPPARLPCRSVHH